MSNSEAKNKIIYRGRRFASVPETIINDPNLSAKAKGFAAYIYFRPDDWTFYMTEVMSHFRDGKDSIRSAFNELIDAGYLRKTQIKNTNGQFSGTIFEISDTPFTEEGKTVDGKTVYGKPATNYIDITKIDSNTPYIYPPKGEAQKKASFNANTIAELFNQTCPSLAKVKLLTKARMSHVENRLKEAGQTPETYEAYLKQFFASVEASDFLTNRKGENRNGWKANFDWLFAPRNFLKVVEGNYVNVSNSPSASLMQAPEGWLGKFFKIYPLETPPASWDSLSEDKKRNIMKLGN